MSAWADLVRIGESVGHSLKVLWKEVWVAFPDVPLALVGQLHFAAEVRARK